MAPSPCVRCVRNRAIIVRPKNRHKLCKECFLDTFETEIHETITLNNLFQHGERIAIGASGGKDSTVLASVLKTLNERYSYGLELVLLSIDEGIKGYRDDSLQTVRNNAKQYGLPLMILGYDDLYGWTMDQVVEQVGKKGNCTYCGVFRRQALDRGAARLGVRHVVTGHNADDMAETVMMNLLRGDLPRLTRATSIVTSTPSLSSSENSFTNVKRSKPLKYAYEKEIVLYAHYKSLEYFCTECIYSPEAFRGSARALIKDLERIRPASILDIVKSGEGMAKQVPMAKEAHSGCKSNGQILAADAEEDSIGGCGSSNGRASGGEMAAVEKKLQQNETAESSQMETEIIPLVNETGHKAAKSRSSTKNGQMNFRKTAAQKLGQCSRCGYISSQPICKACVLLEGLNKNRPRMDIGVESNEQKTAMITSKERLEALKLQSG